MPVKQPGEHHQDEADVQQGLVQKNDKLLEGLQEADHPPTTSTTTAELKDPWEEHIDHRLNFLPHKDAVLTELVTMEALDKKESLKRLDSRVLGRFSECETDTRCERLNLSSLLLKTVPVKPSLYGQLKVLSLRNNKLDELPIQLFAVTQQLEVLILSHNRLEEIPDAISAVTTLKRFVISYNRITSPPPLGLCQCSLLQELDLGNNSIPSLPGQMAQLRHLRKLLVPNNQLTSLPSELCSLKHLTELNIAGNPVVGSSINDKTRQQLVADRLVILNEQYHLARSKDRRQRVIGRANHMRSKLLEAHKKCLIRDRSSLTSIS